MTDNSNDGDLLFDRNDNQNHDDIPEQSLQLKELRRVINESPMSEFTPEIAAARKRIVNKLLDIMSIQNDVDAFSSESIISNPDVIDDDMFTVGEITGRFLKINIPPIDITIDLSQVIRNSMRYKKTDVIHKLMDNNIDLFKIEHRIMTMCIATDQYDLLLKLITNKTPIHSEEYRCIYELASKGKLDLLKAILKNYKFPNIPELISKICIQAVTNNHVNILEYFFPKSAFAGAPDQMFSYFLNSIQHGGHLEIVKFFIKNGISIRQQNYIAVPHAIKYNRDDIIKYFYVVDSTIVDLLNDDQKDAYGFLKFQNVNKYIGTEFWCSISVDDILINDTYFECTNHLHYFKEQLWMEWIKNKSSWICPHCFSPIERIIYKNSN